MGVKSTITLTYEQALDKYVWLRNQQMERQLRAEAYGYTQLELEDILEELNDAYYGGEGFENYFIEGGPRF